MKYLILLIFPIFAFAEAGSQKLKKDDFTTWPRAGAKDFGCFLEKEFGHKDSKFNCSLKKYENKGDPCKNTKAYYQGPKFPAAKASLVNQKIQSIDLEWEHGDLQNISVTLKGRSLAAEAKRSFKLPEEADIQDCGLKNTCIVIRGFDHQGAGDVDCGE